MAEAYDAYRAGTARRVLRAARRRRRGARGGLGDGTYAIDVRLRDALRSLGFGVGRRAARLRRRTAALVRSWTQQSSPAEYTSLGESDLGASFGARIDELEARLGRLEQSPAARVRRLAGSLRS